MSTSEHRALARVAVALDTPDWEQFQSWCETFGPRVGVLKIGLEAYLRWGHKAVETAREHGAKIFLDLKLHDIPNTVAGAVRSVRSLEVDYLTLHASGGRAMIEAAANAAEGQVALLAVTLLTHLDDEALGELQMAGPAAERVASLASLAERSGASGVVCSPRELSTLRPALAAPFELVTPGIRSASDAAGDQKRTATPAAALRDGADLLVIGRPLTQAPDPWGALARLAAELAGDS